MSTDQRYFQTSRFNATRLQTLQANLQGEIFIPGEEGYDRARQTWNAATFDQHPAIVVMPRVPADVLAAVRFASEHDLSIAIQGGGHGHPYPADGALLINFAHMTAIEIKAEAATAHVEPGALWGNVVQAAHPYGLAPLNGFSPTVGVVGYILGGGFGWLTRQYGPAVASIRAIELVTADGELLQVDENNHADLFWGLRGGGGNFGVVTSIEFALYPVETVFGGRVMYPLTQGKEVLSTYRDWVKTIPNELTSSLQIIHFPDKPALPPTLRGTSAITVLACYNGEKEAGETLLQPIRTLGTPLIDTFAQISYSQVATISDDPTEAPPLFVYSESDTFQDISDENIEAILLHASDPGSGIFLLEIRHFGDALTRHREDSMAFSLRRARLSLGIMAAAPTPHLLEGGKQAIATVMQALKSDLTGEILINMLDAGKANLIRAAYTPENYQKLVTLKDRYDKKNVFRFNHNIAPSSEEHNV